MNQFIAFRALQGLGAGIGIALAFVLVADMFPPAERVRWQSLFGVVYGLANLVGPTLGGWLTDHGPLVGALVTETTRWRWVFYVNIPVGIIALTALLIYLPANISARSSHHTGWAAVRRIDFPGAVLSAAATICLLLGLTWGSNATYDWSSLQVIGILASAVILFGAFLLTERFAVEPILPLDLFRNQVFAVAALLSLLQLMILVGLIVYLPLYLQGVLGVSATGAGAVITPMTVSSVIGGALAGFAITVFKRYRLITILSALIMTAGVFLLTRMTPTTGLLEAVVFMVIAGIGLGPFFSVLTIAAQRAVAQVPPGPQHNVIAQQVALQAMQQAQHLLNQVFEALRLSLAVAIQHGFIAVLVFCGATIVAAFFLKDVPMAQQVSETSDETGVVVESGEDLSIVP